MPFFDNHVYTMKNKAGGLMCDLLGSNSGEGAPVAGWPYGVGGYNQCWLFTPVSGSSGVYNVRNVTGGKYLGLSATSGIACGALTGNQNQQWKVIPAETLGFWRLQNVSNNTFLDLSGGSSSAGTKIQGWQSIYPDDAQLWALDRISRSQLEIDTSLKRDEYVSTTIGDKLLSYHVGGIYLILRPGIRDSIWKNANFSANQLRAAVYDSSGFATVTSAAVETWARDNIRVEGITLLWGTVSAQSTATGGAGRAFNLTLLMGQFLDTIVYYDQVAGAEVVPTTYNMSFAVY